MSDGSEERSVGRGRGKAPIGTAISGAVTMLVIGFGGGSLVYGGFDWMTEPSLWWLWVMVITFTGLTFYQIRNNIS